jgi:chitinase
MGTPEDTVNYSLFLEEIRKALDVLGQTKGRTYGLTAALPCGADLIRNIQIDVVSNYLDELNLMTYDFHG